MKFWLQMMAIGSLTAFTACATPAKTSVAPPAPVANPAAKAAVKAGETGSGLEAKCEFKADMRKLIVVPKDGGCELHYEKFGKTDVIASSTKGAEHCDEVQGKIKKNLEASGFKCN